jgi:hypothetical protein
VVCGSPVVRYDFCNKGDRMAEKALAGVEMMFFARGRGLLCKYLEVRKVDAA